MNKLDFAVEYNIPIVCKTKLQKIEIEKRVYGMVSVYTTKEWLDGGHIERHENYVNFKLKDVDNMLKESRIMFNKEIKERLGIE